MDYRILLEEENESVRERYALAALRIRQIRTEESLKGSPSVYFSQVSGFLMDIEKTFQLIEQGEMDKWPLSRLSEWNERLYQDILDDHYEISMANPAHTAELFGTEMGRLLSLVYAEIRGGIAYAFEYRLFDLTCCMELLIELYNLFELVSSGEMAEADLYREVKEAVYYYFSDYSDVKTDYRIRERLDPQLSFFRDIVMESDLEDLRYLYRFGEYISENELETARYLNLLPQQTIDAMAANYTEGYRKGFELAGIDLSRKKTVEIRYRIGFERMIRAAVRQFEAMGLKCIMYRASVHAADRRLEKTGCFGGFANRQYEYDHRFDQALFMDKPFKDRRLAMLRVAYEKYAELAAGLAGPALVETFGEIPFSYINKPENYMLSEKQQKLSVEYASEAGRIGNQYIPGDQTSFTIISYPIPEIGPDFPQIFEETIRINTLDYSRYREIQQTMIDALDQGNQVRIIGAEKNRTDLTVSLWPLADPARQTNFENCLADVNIPLGEVFTSPRLAGTQGLLHVSSVYLRGIEYRDLWLRFADGMAVDYGCANYPDPEEGRMLIKSLLMNNYDALPMGEFAIGTNTTAYAMAKKYDIMNRLKILIIEKMGPHFAVGDTCYSYAEEQRVYNPDGKEITARDNECSRLRHEDYSAAYFNCHTDITIPYDELDTITVICADGRQIPIIGGGKFVLPGTEFLNIPLEND